MLFIYLIIINSLSLAQTQIGLSITGENNGDYSGWAVAISEDGNRIAVGAPNNDGNGSNSGHVRVYQDFFGNWARLGNDLDGEASDDLFGTAVALSGDGARIIIGAKENDGIGIDAGHARVFEYMNGSWVQIGNDIEGEAAGDFFGCAVSISSDGNRIIVGGYENDGNGSNAGFARVFDLIGGTWVQIGTDIEGEAIGDKAGYSVDISADGSTVSVGSPWNARNGTASGTVKVYRLYSGIWLQTGLDIDGDATGFKAGFSNSLSADGNRIAVGIPGGLSSGGAGSSGLVRIYDFIGGGWVQVAGDINAGIGVSNNNAGFSVSLTSDGNQVVVGARGNNARGASTGEARIYRLIKGRWLQVGGDIQGEEMQYLAGHSVAISGGKNRVVIGSPGYTNSTLIGRTQVFEIGGWMQVGEDINGENNGDRFGYSAAISGNGSYMAASTPYNNDYTGNVRVFKCIEDSIWVQIGAKINGESVNDYSGSDLALSYDGHRIIIGAELNDGNGTSSGHVRVLEQVSGTWVQVGGDIDGEMAGDNSGKSVAISSAGNRIAVGARGNDGNGSNSGHVRIYEFIGGAWIQIGGDIDGEASGDESGADVSLSSDGNIVAIGAPRNSGNSGQNSSGHVRIFELVGGNWVQLGSDIDGNPSPELFGSSISLSGDGSKIIIGAPYADANGSLDIGYAKVYEFNSGNWNQVGNTIYGELGADHSGGDVSISYDGDIIAVGADYNDDNGSSAGHARIYEYVNGNWQQLGLDIDGENPGSRLGRSIGLSASGHRIAVGEYRNSGGGSSNGQIRAFKIPPAFDLNVSALSSLSEQLCIDSIQSISLTYINSSRTTIDFAIDSLHIHTTINGPIPQSFQGGLYSGTIAPNDTQTYIITHNADFSLAGTYDITVVGNMGIDQYSGNDTLTMQIIVSGGPTVTGILTQDVQCFEGHDGAASIQITGGIAPYTYLWADSTDTSVHMSLTAGTHSFSIIDSIGCITIDSVNISQPPALVITPISIEPSCFQDSTGSISLTISGGSMPYTSPWGATNTSPSLINNLESGVHEVTVWDNNGCTTIDSISIPELQPIQVQATIIDDICTNGLGSIHVQATGGAGSYTYLWNQGGTTNMLTSLHTGNYTLSAVDSLGCSTQVAYNVGDTCWIAIEILELTSPNPVTCVSNQQEVQISYQNLSNDTIHFDIDSLVLDVQITGPSVQNFHSGVYNGSLAPNESTIKTITIGADFSAMGTYTITIISSLLFDTQISYDTLITQIVANVIPPNVSASLIQNVQCFGNNDGSVQLQANGGIPPYSYDWEDGTSSAIDSILLAGTHTFTVTDSIGCSTIDSITITEPTELVLNAFDIIPSCYQDTTGRATLEVIGGTPPYSFPWNPSGANPYTIMNFPSDAHILVVIDANGCIATDTFFVPELPPVDIQANITNDVCGTGIGSIDIQVNGGTGSSYLYIWGAGNHNGTQLDSLFAGGYVLTVIDSLNCFDRDSLIVSDLCQPPTALFSTHTNTLCEGNSLSIINQSQAGMSFQWNFVGGIPNVSTNEHPSNILYQSSGTYPIELTVMNSLDTVTYRDTITVVSCSSTDASFSASVTSLCENNSIAFTHTGTSSGNSSYQWTFAGGTPSSSTSPTPTITYTTAGQYDVSLILTDVAGSDTVTEVAYITVDTCNGQTPWVTSLTGSNHTIIVDANVFTSDIYGNPISIGDYIGAFYEAGGQEFCAGYTQWDGTSTAIAAVGNELTPPAKNGFDIGEAFRWKIWQSSTQQEIDVQAEYAPQNFLYTHSGAYADDGISGLISLTSVSEHPIILQTGWNMISSYLIPDSMAMESVFRQIESNVLLVKNVQGQIYQPTLGINLIGNWDYEQGYLVKMNMSDTLIIIGQPVPSSTILSLPIGWNIMPYLRSSPMDITTALTGIASDIALVKNNTGQSYVPGLNINQIGDMLPGQGYKVKMLNAASFGYPLRTAPWTTIPTYTPTTAPTHFPIDLNTGNNATLICMNAALSEYMAIGDEIGVFTANGTLAGSGVYEGYHLAITIWGDELSSTTAIEGFAVDEPYALRVWHKATGTETSFYPTYIEGNDTYEIDGISVIGKAGTTGIAGDLDQGISIRCYPNPSKTETFFELSLIESTDVHLAIYDITGKEVATVVNESLSAGEHTFSFDISSLAEGEYLYCIEGISSGKFVVVK